ncbi:MAG TPA: serine hydrolase domain-containing protein [Bryobacteraceae bacterium]|nr:serine hydrolase domain-containing protein [Bryobacteraceae bacterium]
MATATLLLTALAAAAGDRKTLDDLLRNAVGQNRVPAVVAMVATGDAITYQGAFGMDSSAILIIASMTKPVTSVAVMQMVEAGRIKLDAPAAAYLPELAEARVLEGGKLRPPKSRLTVRQLLTHTSGFGYEFMNRELHDYVAAGKAPGMRTGDQRFLGAPLLFDPGARWEYGISVDWLGKLVEKMSGQSLEAYFRTAIFAPLGMDDTFFNVPAEKQPRIAASYHRKKDGTLERHTRAPLKPVTFFSGGGGLFSTASDYMRFARALMAGGSLGGARILRTESVAEMGRNQIGALVLTPFTSLDPQLIRDAATLPGGLDKFGLGFALNTKPVDWGRGAYSMTWAGSLNTFFWIDREKKVCAVLMTQMSPALDDGPRSLLEDFERAVYAK